MKRLLRSALIVLFLTVSIGLLPTLGLPYQPLRATALSLNQYGACFDDCLRSTNIVLRSWPYDNGHVVVGAVVVRDEENRIKRNARVSATWELPDGSIRNRIARTNRRGVARFFVFDGSGTYTLTVTDIRWDDHTFDPDHSVLTESITVP